MNVLHLILIFVVVGVILWAVNTYVPMDANVKKVMNIAVIVVLCLWVLTMFLPLGDIGTVRIQ